MVTQCILHSVIKKEVKAYRLLIIAEILISQSKLNPYYRFDKNQICCISSKAITRDHQYVLSGIFMAIIDSFW